MFKQSKPMLILKDGHNYDIWVIFFYLNNWQEMDLLSEICLNENHDRAMLSGVKASQRVASSCRAFANLTLKTKEVHDVGNINS